MIRNIKKKKKRERDKTLIRMGKENLIRIDKKFDKKVEIDELIKSKVTFSAYWITDNKSLYFIISSDNRKQ